jgi:hypothetical protein
MDPLELSDSEKKTLQKVVKRRKLPELVSGATAVLSGQRPAVGDLSVLAAALGDGKLGGYESQAALVVVRSLPPGGVEAERVSQAIVQEYDKARLEMMKAGCLVPILSLIVMILSPSTPSFVNVVGGNNPTFAIYVRTLQAFKSPRGAAIAAYLASSESTKRPTDMGSLAVAALPDLLAAASGVALPAGDREEIARLVEIQRIDPAVRELAARTLSSLPGLP